MPPDISRRKLVASTVSGGVVGLGAAVAHSGRSSSNREPQTETPGRFHVSVDSVTRIDKTTYEVVYSYENSSAVEIERSQFAAGTAAGEPERDLSAGSGTFTVRWTPMNDSETLVWEVDLQDGRSLQAATPPHKQVREQWTLTVQELRQKFDTFAPSGITVRTGEYSERTMYLHGENCKAMFRIWSDGLVSYETREGWWEVDVRPKELMPATGAVDDGQSAQNARKENQYTFSMESTPYDGSQWMSILLREGTHWGATVFYFFPNHGQETEGLDTNQPDEIYSRISFRLGEEWEQPGEGDTCKIYWAGSNLSAGDAGKGGAKPTGEDGWSVRVYLEGPDHGESVSIGSYVYHLDQEGQFGDQFEWPDEVQIGTWNHIETYVRLNSVSGGKAVRDGALNTYLNGSLQNERADLRWRTTEALGFDRLGPGCYWGGTEVSPRNNYIYYDDFRFSVGNRTISEESSTPATGTGTHPETTRESFDDE